MNQEEKGAVTVLLLHCVFNNDGESMTHFMNSNEKDIELSQVLPNTYSVLIANNDNPSLKRIVGGFIIKTSHTNSQSANFLNTCINITHEKLELGPLLNKETSFIASKLGYSGHAPLTEQEMVLHLTIEFYKKNVSGNA